MTKTILVYTWNSINEHFLLKTLYDTDMNVLTISQKILDYHADAEFANKFLQLIHSQHIDVVFSINYFPIISSLCLINKMPYISWVYDFPLYTLYSKTLSHETNYIFCFDRAYCAQLEKMGAKNCFHLPLAASSQNFNKIILSAENTTDYFHDISFIGSFYNGSKNRLQHTAFNTYTRGYIDGLISSQAQILGYNIIPNVLTRELVNEIATKCDLVLGELYYNVPSQLVADAIGTEITSRNRESAIRTISEAYRIDIYTNSQLPQSISNHPNIINHGTADNIYEMPLIFNRSKINLNITSHTIESGISQRVIDILACGGFCITNYQPEIADYFIDGIDLVMYSNMVDLIDKITYYLNHEEERNEIAKNGKQKVEQSFALATRIQEMTSKIPLS